MPAADFGTPTRGPSPLWDICIDFLAKNIAGVERCGWGDAMPSCVRPTALGHSNPTPRLSRPSHSLEGLPEELVCELFDRVLLFSRLTPAVLRVFKATGHPTLLAYIRRNNIVEDLPMSDFSTEHAWLGYERRL